MTSLGGCAQTHHHLAVEPGFVAAVAWLARCVLVSAQAPHMVALVTGNLGKSLNPPRPQFHICEMGRALLILHNIAIKIQDWMCAAHSRCLVEGCHHQGFQSLRASCLRRWRALFGHPACGHWRVTLQ